ncbi:hypothetical protein GGR50DRAFT_689267 [Xylaria sp. CBS 124048]|nr:hypothetical protein GGR50DRAFT_689267 [Xylaria sp. CBS 124048]
MLLYITICTIFTFARLYTRLRIHEQLWWDDWTMFFAWIGTIAFCTLQIVWTNYGAGVNIGNVPNDKYLIFLKIWLGNQMVARISIFFARLSILLFYIRVFFPIGTTKTVFWWVIQAVIWLNTLYCISLILVLSLQCVPYHLPFGSSCVNQWLVLINASVINIISDVAVLVIPIASIVKLRTTKRKKWAIWALFAFGTLAPLASIARLAYQIPVANGMNKTVIYPIVLILATAEQTVAMIVGSAPIASGIIIRLLRRNQKIPTAPTNRTFSQIIWPAREARIKPAGFTSGGNPSPLSVRHAPITTGSTYALHPSMMDGHHDGESEDCPEMASRTMSNVNKVTTLDKVWGSSYV